MGYVTPQVASPFFLCVAALSLPRFLSCKWKGLELYVKDPLVLQVGFSPGSA